MGERALEVGGRGMRLSMRTDQFFWHPSIVLYSHETFGLGHLSRTVHLARCIREREPGADVLIMTNSPAAHRFTPLEDFEYIKLPSVTKAGVERYHPHCLHTSLESILALRSSLLLSTLQQVRPSVLVVDHKPLGLKKEMLPSLQWIKEHSPRTRTVVGLRDVIGDPATIKKDWEHQGIYDALEHLYDHVLVYGDRSILDSTVEYGMPAAVAAKVRFTGYLGRGAASRPKEVVRRSLGLNHERLVVVHVGGGLDGTNLIETYLRCVPWLPADVHSLVVTGPLMNPEERRRMQQQAPASRVTVVDCQEDLASCVAAADVSICMGGYNTICEALSSGVRALVVPRVFPSREQYIRAQRLASRGLFDVLHPAALTPGTLATRVMAALDAPRSQGDPVPLDGGQRAATFLTSLFRTESRPNRQEEPVAVGAYR